MKKNTDKQLSVRLYGEPAGILTQTLTGKLSFTYLESAKTHLSIAMPIQTKSYDTSHCDAFFGGLLPESTEARKAIAKRHSISPNNDFALLKAIGYDCAGAISFHAINESTFAQNQFPLEANIVTDETLYAHIQALPKKPLFMDFKGLRLSLAGMHDKAAVCLIENQIALPENGCPTTHILKPAIPGLDGIIDNEYFCLKLAAALGLPTPSVEIRHIQDVYFLLIERYDRKIDNNAVSRIHQEDFCQALAIPSNKKYQNEGGAGFQDCFNLLDAITQPAIARNQLASMLVFNFLIGNMDAHAKNFSLLYHHNRTTLAPFYDLICTQAYPDLMSKMAMKIGSQYKPENTLPRHFEKLCLDCHYSYPAMIKLIKEMSNKILEVGDELKGTMTTKNNPDIIDNILNVIEHNATRMLRFLSL